jgi:pimeloyl-ACP methyl ester carboxylesterase
METLLLIPGLMCDHSLWSHQIVHLTELADCQVADTRAGDTMEALAEAILASAPPRFALAGLSMGGLISHAIMARAPERVTRLALIGTNARCDTPEQTARRRSLMAMATDGRFEEITQLLMPALVHPSRLHDEALTEAVRAMARNIGPEAFLRQTEAIIGRPPRLDGLHRYRLPTLILVGREDAITPLELHEEMAAGIPGSELVIIEDCGHLSTLEQPQTVTALLRRWLLYPR